MGFLDKRTKKGNGDKSAIIFPGQGTQKLGMASGISPEIMDELFIQMGKVLRENVISRVKRLVFADASAFSPEEKEKMENELRQTQNAQLAIFLVSLAKFQEYVNSEDFKAPSFVLGHSLGECTALVVSGAMSISDGFRYVFYRGGQMQLATDLENGGMTAIRGVIKNQVVEKCLKGSDVEIANYNSPVEIVISGSLEGLAGVEEALKEKGPLTVNRLRVAGAFHHPVYMKLVEAALEQFIEKFQIEIKKPIFNMVFNYTGSSENDPKRIKNYIVRQPTNTVRWQQSIEFLIKSGIRDRDSVKEIGPGKIFTRQLADFQGLK